MATLKGQNFRVLLYDTTAAKYKVVGMSTNCTINMTNNTDDSTTKDDTGMASKPTMTNQTWSVQVESLDVSDVGAMLTAIKNKTVFTLMWDSVSTANNQTPDGSERNQSGHAYLSDATFTFDDRTNSTKQLQFTGTGGLEHLIVEPGFTSVSGGSYTKGQFVRLFLSSDNTEAPDAVIAAAKTLSLHVSVTLESATTKDTTGTYEVYEPTALNYDITTSALVKGADTITSAVGNKRIDDFENFYKEGTPIKWKIANVNGDNNRTATSTICSGSALLTSLQISAPNRSDATYQATLNGYGQYTVGA